MLALLLLGSLAHAGTIRVCPAGDARVPTQDPRIGRTAGLNCTATLVSPGCLLTAGHCMRGLREVRFNVEPSRGRGAARRPQDSYRVDPSTVEGVDRGLEEDWAVFRVLPNSHTRTLPGVRSGFYPLAGRHPRVGERVRIAGYGDDLRGNRARHRLLQTASGRIRAVYPSFLQHDVDTEHGNSGSAILSETGEIIGVHTRGRCADGAVENWGISLAGTPALQEALRRCREPDL